MALSSAKHEAIHDKTGADLAAIKDNFDNGKHLDAIDNDKVSMTLGTSGSTALAGDTALLALGTSGSTALAGDTNIVTIGSSTTIAFGDMVTVTGKKGGPSTYNIVMTVTNGGVSKAITLTLA